MLRSATISPPLPSPLPPLPRQPPSHPPHPPTSTGADRQQCQWGQSGCLVQSLRPLSIPRLLHFLLVCGRGLWWGGWGYGVCTHTHHPGEHSAHGEGKGSNPWLDVFCFFLSLYRVLDTNFPLLRYACVPSETVVHIISCSYTCSSTNLSCSCYCVLWLLSLSPLPPPPPSRTAMKSS